MLLRIALRVENYRRRTVNKRLPQLLYVSFRIERFANSRMSPLNLCNTVRPFSNCFLTYRSARWQKFLITYLLYSCVFSHANFIFNYLLPYDSVGKHSANMFGNISLYARSHHSSLTPLVTAVLTLFFRADHPSRQR